MNPSQCQSNPSISNSRNITWLYSNSKVNNNFIVDCIYEEILIYHFKDFQEEYEKKKRAGDSLISHIVGNLNAKIIDPDADDDD